MYLNKEGEGVKKIPLKQIPVGYFKKQSECLKSCDDLINMIAKKNTSNKTNCTQSMVYLIFFFLFRM